MNFSFSACKAATFSLLLTATCACIAVPAYTLEERGRLLAAGCNTLSGSPGDRRHAEDVVKSFDYRSLAGDQLSGFALCAASAGNHELAVTAWSQFIENTPQPYFAHHSRASSYLALGQADAAINDLKFSLAHDLGGEEDLPLLTKIYVDRGDSRTVVELLEGEIKRIEAREPSPGHHVYSPGEERLALALSSAYGKLGNMAATCSTLEWGYTRNKLSQKLFDALIPCLQKTRKPKAIDKYRAIGCADLLVSRSPFCTAGRKN